MHGMAALEVNWGFDSSNGAFFIGSAKGRNPTNLNRLTLLCTAQSADLPTAQILQLADHEIIYNNLILVDLTIFIPRYRPVADSQYPTFDATHLNHLLFVIRL
jgi:hypothetical protein